MLVSRNKQNTEASLLTKRAMLGLVMVAASACWCASSLAQDLRKDGVADERKLQAIDAPLSIELSVNEAAITRGNVVQITVDAKAATALDNVKFEINAGGRSMLLNRPDVDRDFVGDEEVVSFRVPLQMTDLGNAKVVVTARARVSGTDFTFSQTGELNILLRDDRAFAGMEAPKNLERRALNYDVQTNRIGAQEAATRRKSLSAVNTIPGVARGNWEPLPPPMAIKRVEPRVIQNWESEQEDPYGAGGVAGGTSTNITVEGIVQYTDETGSLHPVFGYEVLILDDDTIGSDTIAQLLTPPDGTYSVTFDSDDADGPDIYIEFRPINTLIEVRPMGGGSYVNTTGIYNNVSSNTTITENLTFAATGDGPVGSMCSGGTWVAVYTRDELNGGVGLSQLPIEFPGATTSANYDGSRINMRPNDRFDWDVLFHEFGHYVMDEFDFEDNSGGPHNIGDCVSVVPSMGSATKDRGVRLAWGEGWPTFFGTVAQLEYSLGFTQAPRVGDVVYQDTVDGFDGFSYSLETNSNPTSGASDSNGLGEDNEVAVQRLLFDLYDSNSDSRDTESHTDLTLFNIFKNTNVTTLSAAWALVRASSIDPNNQSDLSIGAITTDHAIGPEPLSPASGSIVNPGDTLSWAAWVGCDPSFFGDGFDLKLYDDTTFNVLLTFAGLGSTSQMLSGANVITVTTVTHDVVWAVEGRNSSDPATGPYLGDNFAAIINTIPTCDAGGNVDDDTRYEAPCAGPGTTIALNGSGSDADPIDQDILTYEWTTTCPFATFDDDTDPTTNLVFNEINDCPEECTVTLEVSDGIQSSECTTTVLLIDETPPMATCEPTQELYLVDENCEATVVFTSTVTDNCCLDSSEISATISLATSNAMLEFNEDVNCQLIQVTDNQVDVSCSAVVSNLTSCPVVVDFIVEANDCCDISLTEPCVASALVEDQTPPEVTCPEDITLERGDKLCTDDVQDWLDSFTATDNCANLPESYQSDFLALAIPDNNATGVSHTINVPDSFTVDLVHLDLRATHPHVGDLVVEIEHLGTTVTVIDRPGVPAIDADGCDAANYKHIVLADEAGTTPIEDACADDLTTPPLYSPNNPLSAFAGLDSAGPWTITVKDQWGSNEGTLDTWGIRLNGDLTLTNDAPPCGFPYDSTTEVTFTATDACNNSTSCTAEITILPPRRVDVSKKGSILVYPNVELKWQPVAGGGYVNTQDTFLSITNDVAADVDVHFLFVDGDDALAAVQLGNPPQIIERAHNGWGKFNWTRELTAHQSRYFSAMTGQPAGAPSFLGLDNGSGGPGRPDPESNVGGRYLRGFVLAWAVDSLGNEITWNHLTGRATIVDYAQTAAWEYEPYAYSTTCLAQAAQPLDCTLYDENGTCCTAEVIPGNLDLDGFQYDVGFNQLVLDFFAVGATPFIQGGVTGMVNTDLTVLPMIQDLRQDTIGPVTTKARVDVWNSNEDYLSNTDRCLTCWDQVLLANFGIPNNFLVDALNTDKGKARMTGSASDTVCDPPFCCDRTDFACQSEFAFEFGSEAPICSEPSPLLGTAMKIIAYSGAGMGRDYAGVPLVGQGININGRIEADLPSESEQARQTRVAPYATMKEGKTERDQVRRPEQ